MNKREKSCSDPEAADERTSLPSKRNRGEQVDVDVASVCDDDSELKQSALGALSDRNFWALAFVVFVILGSCEMIISNISGIVLSLPKLIPGSASADTPSTVLMTAIQVRALSIANTLSRLFVGPLADVVSPAPSPDGRGFLRKHLVSRVAFLAFSTAALVLTYAWMIVGVRDQAGIWALSIGAGTAYGCAFAVLPSIVSSIWGLSNLGRNYGIITYAPFIGTPAFSYLYAFISDAGAV